MSSANFPLDQITVASPCTASWAAMQGDDRVRYCDQCQLNVYHLSAMDRADAETLVQSTEGRLCIRFYRRRDGTVLTRDCPIGLSLRRRALAKSLAAAGLVFGMLLGIASAIGLPKRIVTRLQTLEPFSRLALLQPKPPVRPLMGSVTMGDVVMGKRVPSSQVNIPKSVSPLGKQTKR